MALGVVAEARSLLRGGALFGMGAGRLPFPKGSFLIGVIKVPKVFIHPIAYNLPALSPLADDALDNQVINRFVDVLPLHFEDEGNFSLGDAAAGAYRNRCKDD